MKCLIQRVKNASCTIDNKLYSSIDKGILALVGIEKGDTREQVEWVAQKVVNLRIFEDENGKMNKSLKDINGELLIVSHFTFCGYFKKGTRPIFDKSVKPELANELYEEFVTIVKELDVQVGTGKFGAMMEISLINDGPVTFMVEK